jgi:hypothetical protein
LNIDLDTKNERQDCKIVQCLRGVVFVRGRRVNEGDSGEGIWLMDFLYEIKQRNLLQ